MALSPSPVFIADALALDFLNTVAAPIDETIDFLQDGEGLLAWLERTQLVAPATLAQLRQRAGAGQLDAIAAQAREIREWFREFVLARRGHRLTAGDLAATERLNRMLEGDGSFTTLVAGDENGDSPLRAQVVRRCGSPQTLLMPIAEMLARFVCEQDFAHVKTCEGSACDLLFADHTRQKTRRWCSMAMCGNRAKQAAHRGRAKGP